MKFLLNINTQALLRLSIGLVYFWFGALKFFPGISPAEQLAGDTISVLSFGIIPDSVAMTLLAFGETLIGFLLIAGLYTRIAIVLALLHMVFTFTPLLLFPELSFGAMPFQYSIVGQYIFKNIIIVSALLFLFQYETKRIKESNS